MSRRQRQGQGEDRRIASVRSRFSANASKAKQATSRARQIEKIKLEDVKPSSRQYPFIRFEVRRARKAASPGGGSGEDGQGLRPHAVLQPEFPHRRGRERRHHRPQRHRQDHAAALPRWAIWQPDTGTVKWAEKAKLGYFAQDHAADFAEDMTLIDWMTQWRGPNDDDQAVRGTLGRLLFSGDDVKKSVKVLSGGEKGRMLFGKLMLAKSNVLLMDEPTNHLDMESIESLNTALEITKAR